MRLAPTLLLLASLGLSGCAGFSDVAPEAAGLGVGASAGVLTANPLVGVVAAMVTRLATAEAIDWMESNQRARVQQAIAGTGGDAALDAVVPWKTEPETTLDAFYGTVTGHLQVIRAFGGLISCRELLYTVATPKGGLEGTLDTTESTVSSDATAVEGDVEASASDVATAVTGADTAPSPPPTGADADAAAVPSPPPSSPASAPAPAPVATAWPQAETGTVLVAAICNSGAGWHWAVSRPLTQASW